MDSWDSKAEYALAAAADLAAHYAPGLPVKVSEIARRTGAPPKYLTQLLPRLRSSGLVSSTKGPRGGYRLMRPPDRISVAEVLSAVSTPYGRHRSFSLSEPYRLALDRVSAELEAARRGLLRRVTLARLAQMLQGPGAGAEAEAEAAGGGNAADRG